MHASLPTEKKTAGLEHDNKIQQKAKKLRQQGQDSEIRDALVDINDFQSEQLVGDSMMEESRTRTIKKKFTVSVVKEVDYPQAKTRNTSKENSWTIDKISVFPSLMPNANNSNS